MEKDEIILLIGVCLLVFCTLVAGILATWKFVDRLSLKEFDHAPVAGDTEATKHSHTVNLQVPQLKRVRFASTVQIC